MSAYRPSPKSGRPDRLTVRQRRVLTALAVVAVFVLVAVIGGWLALPGDPP